MAWVMSVLGALLALGGGISLWNGSGYIRMDWGQAETVAGTVALSAGVVTIGLAAVLFTLRDFARMPARAAAPAVAPDAQYFPGELAGADPEAVPLPTIPAPASAALERPPADPAATKPTARSPEPAPPAYGQSAPPVPEAPRLAAAPAMAEAPTVVGRYEANGASYVLFSDGTIEVETENGTHRFDSMAHLKEHIEAQEAG